MSPFPILPAFIGVGLLVLVANISGSLGLAPRTGMLFTAIVCGFLGALFTGLSYISGGE